MGFYLWVNELRTHLVAPEAEFCTKSASTIILRAWYKYGFTTSAVSALLNKRYEENWHAQSSTSGAHNSQEVI